MLQAREQGGRSLLRSSTFSTDAEAVGGGREARDTTWAQSRDTSLMQQANNRANL